MDPLFEIELSPRDRGKRDASRWLYRELRAAIVDGRLVAGSRLPSTRRAAAHFAVARNTAAEVYERLVREGLLVGKRGAGTYVAAKPPARKRATKPKVPALEQLVNPVWHQPELTSALGFWRDNLEPSPPAATIDFRPALVDLRRFPFDRFRGSMARALRTLGRRPPRLKSAQGNQGSHALRVAISQHLSLTRGVACEPDEILVTAGAQQAFDLLARVLVKPASTVVAVEDPGYPPMRVPFVAAGARVVPVGVDADGLVVDAIPRDAKLVCTCPSHQFPLGTTMSAARRETLLDHARRHDALIVEDDYDGEFRHSGTPVAALRGRGADERVFYVGTFSKCMFPALRLGYVVAPRWALPALITAKNSVDWHCSTPIQLAVADFITDGSLARHVTRMRALYDERRRVLLRELPSWLTPLPSSYGMHVAALSPSPLDTRELSRRHVHVHDLARYYLGPPALTGVVFGLGTADPADITKAIRLASGLKPEA